MKHRPVPTGVDPLLTISQLPAIVIYSRSQLYRMIKAGSFPRPIRLGPGRVGWRQSAVTAWLNEREAAGSLLRSI